MRNGVEVIVATDRFVRPVEPEYLRILSSTVVRPITLAPHTLTNLMSMVLSSEKVTNDKSNFIHLLQPSLTTKTFYTTYKYKTTALKNNSTTLTDSEMIVSNVKTELIKNTEGKNLQTEFTSIINASPALQTEVYSTAYTYLNSLLDGDQFIVASSVQTISNSLVGLYDSFNELEPSEIFPTTNTYLKTLELTKTLTDGTDYQVISTKDVATQVIITDKPKKKITSIPTTTDVTKTYFVTYTYFSTYLEGDKTKVKSDVSVSSDVTIEKFYIKPKKTSTKNAFGVKTMESPISATSFPFNIVATKTYLTTLTYYTNPLHSTDGASKINIKTKIEENTVTEIIPQENFNKEYLVSLNSTLNKISGSIVAKATMKEGDPIVITAYKGLLLSKSYQKYDIKPTKSIFNDAFKTETNYIDTFEKQSNSPVTLPEVNSSIKDSKNYSIKVTKTKLNQPTAEALIATEEEIFATVTPTVVMTKATPTLESVNSYPISLSSSKTSLPNSVNTQDVTIIPESEGSHLKEVSDNEVSTSTPDNQKEDLKLSKNQTNVGGLLNLNNLGINGISVLKPVFNAMAELINNKISKNSDVLTRRNDTVSFTTDQELKKPQINNLNPLLSFVNKFIPATSKNTVENKVKTTTPRTPLYIPVGSFAQDPNAEESQDSSVVIANRQDNWEENLKNIQAKNFEKLRPQDPITILEGGIPISPGEVITTNSDVIIGRPGESGPRPPKIIVKNNVPVDMKPPPVPPLILNGDDGDHFIGQQSIHTGVNFNLNKEKGSVLSLQRPPQSLPKKQNHENNSFKNGHSSLNDRRKGSNHQKNSQFYKPPRVKYDSGTMDLNPPPMPPLPVRTHDIHRPITVNHEPEQETAPKKSSQTVISIPVPLKSNQNVENYLNPANIASSALGLPLAPPISQIYQTDFAHLAGATPSLDIINQKGVLQKPTIPQISTIPLYLPQPINQNSVERSSGHPLLVNIQPSQVANIVIPHGSSSALIVSGNKQHSLKGEVIDEPSPHPESEAVGFVGAEPLLKIESEEVPIAVHNEVIPGSSKDKLKINADNNRLIILNNPQLQTELIKIRPKPLKINKLPEQHFPQEHQNQIHQYVNPLLGPQQQTIIQNQPFASSGSNQVTFLENHPQVESHNQNGESEKHLQQSHQYEGQNSGIYFNHNLDLHSLNSVKGNIGTEVYLNKNLNKEGQKINLGVSNNHGNFKGSLNSNNDFEKTHSVAQIGGDTSTNFHKVHNEPVILTEGQTIVKGGNGIYVDISPPGHLSPRPQLIVGPENHSSTNHFLNLKENLSHHQFGIVHDVPLNVQVQSGSSQIKTENHPLKEILVDINTSSSNGLRQDSKVDPKFVEAQNSIKKPLEDSLDYLSPPPLYSEANTYSFVRHSVNPPQSKPISQKHHIQPQLNIRQPVDFMVPPPQVFPSPTKVKPHLELNSRPVIPIGAGAPSYSYTHPKQEDMVIVPNKSRPSNVGLDFGGPYKQDHHNRPTSTIYSDLDTSGTSGPFKTEYGEEIQESISRPLLPGEIPNELKVLEKNISIKHNNKATENVNVKPVSKITESSNIKNTQYFGERTTVKIPVVSDYWSVKPWSNSSIFWTNTNNNIRIKGENKQTSEVSYFGSASDSIFSNIKKPTGFVSSNKSYDSPQNFNRFQNHKETYGFVQPHNKEGNNISNHKDSIFILDSSKSSPKEKNTHLNNVKKENAANIPTGFFVSSANSLNENKGSINIRENELNKHFEFIKNDKNKTTQISSNNTNHKESQLKTSETKQNIITSPDSDNTKWNQEIVKDNKDVEDKNIIYGIPEKKVEEITPSKNSKPFKIKDHNVNKSEIGDKTIAHFENSKIPDIYDLNNKNRPIYYQQNSSRPAGDFEKQIIITPTNIPDLQDPFSTTIKSNSNKDHAIRPSLKPTSPKKPVRYPITNGLSRPISSLDLSAQNNLQIKRPSGFISNKKEEQTKIGTINKPFRDNVVSPTTDIKQLPSNENDLHRPGISVPSGFVNKNETFSKFNLNHNYGNKTINIYKDKPISTTKVQTIIYNDEENETDKWFLTKYGDRNSNVDNGAMPTKINKLISSGAQQNTTFAANAAVSSPNVQISVLTPPKITGLKMKPEEVMGLSPPPLERPRRPQKPQRPKPPYKFDGPTTPKSSLKPITIENDFPPVRSPDFNKKPLKPQDIFPPRLPSNFVHHLPEYPIKPPLQSRPRPTSLPIDLPTSSTTEKHNTKVINPENVDISDSVFAGAEINGHSKPILKENPVIISKKPHLPVPDSNKDKLNFQPKLSTVYQQTTKTEEKESGKLKNNFDGIKQSAIKSSIKEDISPTRTINAPITTTYHTKVTASVTPTFTHPYNEWQDSDIITGSETIFNPEQLSNQVTPIINEAFENKKKIVTTLISTGSTTIFGNFHTKKPDKNSKGTYKPSLDFETEEIIENTKEIDNFSKHYIEPTPTIAPVITTTLTVTSTMTTIVHSVGHKPSLKTVVVTKTLISTVFNKVTETKTLVQPTTATIIQTHTVSTTKTAVVVPTALYPSQVKYPTGGSLKPEIFVADPHAKDTMTISVSSSMTKNKNKEEKLRTNGQTITSSDKTDGDSILVVMTNKHPNIELSSHDDLDVVGNEENEINDDRVMVGGVFHGDDEKELLRGTECYPACKAKKNELCQKIDGLMKCVCRPGFARMFPDRPCKPTYTYNVKLLLEQKYGTEKLTQEASPGSLQMAKLTSMTKEGLDRMIMQSELRDVYHGILVNGFQNKEKNTMVDFYVQLSENTNEEKLMSIFKKTLQTTNFSLGGTELFAAREADSLSAEDFNECQNPKFHDCSEHARCFNLKGTYTCSCKEGFTDVSENSLFPGRVCSDVIGCEYCGYHGACYAKGEGQMTCECFQWYSGDRCHINLKVFLIALVTIGAILLALLLVCAVFTCINRRSKGSTISKSRGYLRYKGPTNRSIDRRAMIADSSSESSVDNLPYINPPPLPLTTAPGNIKKKPALRHVKGPAPKPAPPGMEQRDKSVTVMIPRAKYRPMPPLSPHLTMSTFSPDKHLPKKAAQIATEQKLISYLDGNTREERAIVNAKSQNGRLEKEQQKIYDYKISGGNNDSPRPTDKKEFKIFEYEYKISNMLFSEETNSAERKSVKSSDDRFRRHSDSAQLYSDRNRDFQFRKYSAGALVSAGYEVSAKVGMHHLEEDTTEDEHSGILNTHTMKSNRSQFTTLNRTGDHKTMSEARSYEETTVHPQTRSLKTHYSGSSPSSRANNDEGHTMIERDTGSTFIMPESQLFKPEADRGSDISNFDSL